MAGMADVISRLAVFLELNTVAFEKGTDLAGKSLKRMERDFERSGKKLQELGKKLTLAISAPVAAAGVAVVKMAGDFEKSMIQLGISSQASADQLKQMSDLALKLGKDTIFGASDAANAMDELAKSGLSATEILNGAAEATVYLATATGSELSPAANAITDSMKQFGLTTAQLPTAINQITGAVNESKLDFADYALAIGQAGGVAGGLGVDFTDFNTVLAATSSLFASGSDAGTSFKTFLTSLSGNSKQAQKAIAAFGLQFYEANGNLRSMAEIAEELRQKLGGLSDQAKTDVLKRIFGTDAMRTAIGLMNQGADGLDRVAEAIRKTDAAAQSAERMKGFYGQLENLKGAIETLAIRVGQSGVLEAVTALVTKIGDLIDWMSGASPTVLRFSALIAGIAAVVGPTIYAIGLVRASLAPLFVLLTARIIPAFTAFAWQLAAIATTAGPAAAAMRLLAVALRGLLIATGVGAAIAVVVAVLDRLIFGSDKAREATEKLNRQYGESQTQLDGMIAKLRAAGVSTDDLARISEIAAGRVDKLAKKYQRASVEAHKMATEISKATIALLAQAAAAGAAGKADADRASLELQAERRNQRRREGFVGLFGGSGDPDRASADRIAALEKRIEDGRAEQNRANAIQEAALIAFNRKISLADSPSPASGSPVSGTGFGDGEGSSTKRGPRDRTDELAARAAQDRYNLEIEQLRAQAALTTDVEARAEFERQILGKERETRYAELDAAVKSGELTKAQADAQREILRALYGRANAERDAESIEAATNKSLYDQKLEQELRLQLFEDANDLAEERHRADIDALRNQFDLADTDAERKDIALRILDAEDAYLRSKLESVIANKDLAKAVRDQAEIALNALNASAGARREVVSRQNETASERYLRDLNKTPAQINEAIEAIKIDGLQALNNQIADAIVNFKSMGDVFANVIKQMIADLIRLQLQKSLIAPLAKFLGLGDSSTPGLGSLGSSIAKIGNALGGIKGIGKNANGTSFWRGGPTLVGERGPELVDLPRGARVTPNSDLGGLGGLGGGKVEIVPSPYFDVVVDGRVLRAAPGIAQAGAQVGLARMQYAQSRRWR